MWSKGIRNKNPGNIRKGPHNWIGIIGDDGEFVIFSNMVFGIRAMTRILRNYRKYHYLQTQNEFIAKWAPPSENDTKAYQDHVKKFTKLEGDQFFPLDDKEKLHLLIKGMIQHENGDNPIHDIEIVAGILLEGVM